MYAAPGAPFTYVICICLAILGVVKVVIVTNHYKYKQPIGGGLLLVEK